VAPSLSGRRGESILELADGELAAERFAHDLAPGSSGAGSKAIELRKRMMPFAEAAGYLTDEDVFRDVS
jgi:hypothetical protein